ncbi:MAG: hypothetical protein J7M25_00805 [Deltaproteobacteria bacterium]|nr:hypothetical protein [Deltaproteobacteria bacterium]
MASAVGVVVTSVYARHWPSYSFAEWELLFILFALFVSVNGLRSSGAISKISQRIDRGRAIPFKLVVTTFFFSMLVTNDVALVVMVPLTLALNLDRKDLLVIAEALAANAGSALTPFGNPQNLFIYWFYGLGLGPFLATIVPFAAVFLILLVVASLFIKARPVAECPGVSQQVGRLAYVYGILIILVLLTVLHVLPVGTVLLVFLFAVIFDRQALRVDYALLFSFLFFFGLADNLQVVLAARVTHSEHVFLFSALASQVMSNVPATLLFAKFTTNWQALLWGVNVGGFGSLFGSLANLIAYKIYVTHEDVEHSETFAARFTAKFLIAGYLAFFIGIGLYFVVRR